mmetsp:Transcript_24322/g.34879  ORF Transcript_24322/g.34879 Transcript_24322/m.34879 type:complete len:285 (+) Transcript_24322:27-881(+)
MWDFLNSNIAILIGEESLNSFLWMSLVIMGRIACILTGLVKFIPDGVIFGILPVAIISMCSSFNFFPSSSALFLPLPVRLTESVMGRLNPQELLVLIPAHVFGSLMSITCASVLSSSISGLSDLAFQPIAFNQPPTISLYMLEIFLTTCFIISLIVLPQLFEVNRLNPSLIWIPLAAINLIGGNILTFNPVGIYTLWFVNNGSTWSLGTRLLNKAAVYASSFLGRDIITNTVYNSTSTQTFLTSPHSYLSIGHIIAPMAAAIIAGIICNCIFPDDPTTWLRKRG